MSHAEEYERLMTAFEALQDAGASERAERLEVLTAQDPALARQLAKLLAVDEKAYAPLERPMDLWDIPEDEDPAPASPPRALPVDLGASVGLYRLTEVIGRGGMGCVYRAQHAHLERAAAVKVLEPRLSDDGEYVARFLHEAKVVSGLRHPNIVDVFDFIETENPRRVALVMELLPGSTLAELLNRRPLGLEETVSACLQLCDALATVHAHGVVHRDLKPANVMVIGSLEAEEHAGPSVKLLDFGIAKVPSPNAQRTATGVMLGTPSYMAPEQFAAETPTPATDVYGLAELIYEMLTQEPVFSDRGLRMVRRKMSGAPDLELPNTVPHRDALRRLLQACLQAEPPDRPKIGDIRTELSTLGGLPTGAAAPRAASIPSEAPPSLGKVPSSLGEALSSRDEALPSRDEALPSREEPSPTPSPSARERREARPSVPRGAWLAGLGLAVLMGLWLSPRPEEARPGLGVPKAELPAVIYGEPPVNTPYFATGFMGDLEALELDPSWTQNPRSGDTCLRVRFAKPSGWAGLAWLHPQDDWGAFPGGLDMGGAERLSWWARSDLEGMELKVGYGLLLKDKEFHDTDREEQIVVLSTAWKEYFFDLRGKNLDRIKAPFYFVLEAPPPGGADSFYLDDIRFE